MAMEHLLQAALTDLLLRCYHKEWHHLEHGVAIIIIKSLRLRTPCMYICVHVDVYLCAPPMKLCVHVIHNKPDFQTGGTCQLAKTDRLMLRQSG